MADIFISSSRIDRLLTASLAGDLKGHGHSVWWDASLLPGESFRRVILKELDAAKAAIVIWSPASILSDWVIVEAERAKAQNKLVTVRSANVAPIDIPPPFGVCHTSLIDDRESIYAALAKLRAMPPRITAKISLAGKIRPKPPINLPWRLIGAGAFSIAAAASAYTLWPRRSECTDLAWSLVQKTESLPILRGFVADCKGSRYGDLAYEELGHREDTAYQEARYENTLGAYQFFEMVWPNGYFVLGARTRIAEIIKRQKEEAENRAAEEARWVKSTSANDIADYQAYLHDWPKGLYAEAAKERIEGLQAAAAYAERRRADAAKASE
jgi:hypothetical protein